MIGTLAFGRGRTATLHDDLTWTLDPPDAVLSDYLNSTFGSGNFEPGDHHAPKGAALLYRAAGTLGAPVGDAPAPYPPLPEGVVS